MTSIEYLKQEVAEHPDAPEAIEFWRWSAVPRTWGNRVEVSVMDPADMSVMDESLLEHECAVKTVAVHPCIWLELGGDRIRVGWSTHHRIVVAWILE